LAGWFSLVYPLILTAEENGDIFLSQSPFQKMVVFVNPALQITESRIFEGAEIDPEKNMVFRMENQVPLILPASRIVAIVPVPPDQSAENSLIDLRKGLEECSKVKDTTPEISQMISKWRILVSEKEKQIGVEKAQEEERKSKAIQDAALEKAAEELAGARHYVDNYDRLAVRSQVEEGLSLINRLNPKLFDHEDQLQKARRYWEFILSLPPKAPVPTQWPFIMPVDQFVKTSNEAGQLPTNTFVLALFFGWVILTIVLISRFQKAFQNQAWVPVIFSGSLCLVIFGFFAATFFFVPQTPGGARLVLFEKSEWNDKDFMQIIFFQNKEEIQIEAHLSLGSSFYSLPLNFRFLQGDTTTPSALRVNKAFIGIIPLPKQVGEWVWTQLSPCYDWVD
jgi:hypothetical protein